jgi:hypothetical protein
MPNTRGGWNCCSCEYFFSIKNTQHKGLNINRLISVIEYVFYTTKRIYYEKKKIPAVVENVSPPHWVYVYFLASPATNWRLCVLIVVISMCLIDYHIINYPCQLLHCYPASVCPTVCLSTNLMLLRILITILLFWLKEVRSIFMTFLYHIFQWRLLGRDNVVIAISCSTPMQLEKRLFWWVGFRRLFWLSEFWFKAWLPKKFIWLKWWN